MKLVSFYEQRNAEIVILYEYGIAPVRNPLHLNRIFREHGLLAIREERGLELLDPGASKAFVVADHQIAHVYINDPSSSAKVISILKQVKGVELILDKTQQSEYNIEHERSGDLVLMADEDSWFTYYFWLDDEKAPDYARCVDIHKKPGYDPVEMFMSSKLRAGYKLLRKKAGFRYVMDVIPLDAGLVRGSHGRTGVPPEYQPVLISDKRSLGDKFIATDVYDLIWEILTNNKG
jgi:predicted AlkP superfamily pyrophosphatase or phosphodiesterase